MSTRPVPARPLTAPPSAYELVVHVMVTFVMLLPATVPPPLATAQVWLRFAGCVATVTLYAPDTAVENVNAPLAATVRLLPPLFWRTSPAPAKPVTVPPMVNVAGGGGEPPPPPPPQA